MQNETDKSILIVDDEESLRDVMRFFLQKNNYSCCIAKNVNDALSIIEKENLSLVISDVVMPGKDGIQLMREAKHAYPDLDFIIMTGYYSEYSFADIISNGASDYMTKPFEMKELIVKIERIERERRIISQLQDTNTRLTKAITRANEMAKKAELAEDQIRVLTQELFKVQEIERQKISRDLHDKIAQDLSTRKINCQTLFDNLPDLSKDTKKKITIMSELLQGSIIAVRDLAYGLHPPSLDQLGLIHTFFQFCEDLFSKEKGIVFDFSSAGLDDVRLNFETEINLYRIFQEALNNIIKHSGADYVTIKLVASYPHIILRIEDNGSGFDVDKRQTAAVTEKRMGIRSMRERTSLLDGEMKIHSQVNMGTKISITVPYITR